MSTRIIRTNRRVIEKKLLDGITDGDHVAILVNEEDLGVLIDSLTYFTGASGGSCPPASNLLSGLKDLRKEAFQ